MWNSGWILVVLGTLCARLAAQSAGDPAVRQQKVVHQAVVLAGLESAQLPIVLTSALPSIVSPRAEAWTVFDETCRGYRVYVYTRSSMFQCASDASPSQPQCLLKLASVIVHEAWHLRHGPDEARAYTAQLTFLQLIEASAFLQSNDAAAKEIAEIRRSRRRALADQRKAGKTAGRGASGQTCQNPTIYAPG